MATKRELLKEISQSVVVGNDLIQKSRYELSKMEQKTLLYMISKIKPFDEEGTSYTFNAENFCKVCNFKVDGGYYLQAVKEAVLELKSHPVEIPLSNGRVLITSWFHDAIIDKKTGEITVYFSYFLTPYLYELQKHFTKFYLEYVLPMKSEYGIRLYEYLKSVEHLGSRHCITLDELRQRVGCEGKYTQSSDIRKWVLLPALNDINNFTDIDIDFKFIKTGKKVSHIEFLILKVRDDYENDVRQMRRDRVLGSSRDSWSGELKPRE